MYRKFLSLIMMLLCLCGKVMAQGTADLVIADATATPRQTITVPVTMTGAASGLQFAVYPPKGVTIKKITRGDVVKLRDEEDEYVFTFRTGDRPDNGRFVLCYSIGVPTEEAGIVANIVFEVGEDVAPGTYDILMNEAECAHSRYNLSTYSERVSQLTVTATTGIEGVEANTVVDHAIVYNMAGQVFKKINGSKTAGEIMSELPSGVYVVKSSKLSFKIMK